LVFDVNIDHDPNGPTLRRDNRVLDYSPLRPRSCPSYLWDCQRDVACLADSRARGQADHSADTLTGPTSTEAEGPQTGCPCRSVKRAPARMAPVPPLPKEGFDIVPIAAGRSQIASPHCLTLASWHNRRMPLTQVLIPSPAPQYRPCDEAYTAKATAPVPGWPELEKSGPARQSLGASFGEAQVASGPRNFRASTWRCQ